MICSRGQKQKCSDQFCVFRISRTLTPKRAPDPKYMLVYEADVDAKCNAKVEPHMNSTLPWGKGFPEKVILDILNRDLLSDSAKIWSFGAVSGAFESLTQK